MYLSNYLNVNFTGFTGGFQIYNGISAYGNFTLGSGMTTGTSSNNLTFRATSGSQDISTNGVTVNFPIVVNAPGTLLVSTNGAFTSTSSFSINSYTPFYPGGSLTVSSYYSASTAYTYYNYTFTITGSGACFTQVGVTAGVSYDITTPLTLTSSSPKTFAGGGSSFGVINQGGAGALTITGNNTFADLTATAGGRPSTISFTAGTTSTFTNFTLSGTAGNLVTVGSATAASHTLSKSSGYVTASYLSISRSTATGGAGWYAPPPTNTNGGNNTGWLFTALPPPVSIGTGITIGGGITIG
jgi:hypothetical protein